LRLQLKEIAEHFEIITNMSTSASTGSPPPDDSNASSILAINASFTGFAFLAVVLRLYIRSVMLKTMGLDDYAIAAAMVD
jgi:hypothetical protein